jgi:NADH:ubiquinone oxidoreductase subunit H
LRVSSRQLSQPRAESSSVGFIQQLGGGIGLIVWFGIAAALLSPVLRRGAIDLTLGLLTVMFGSAALLGVWQLAQGGRIGPRWSLLKGIRAALLQCVIVAPGCLAVLSTCFETGVDFDDMVRAQGVAPWNWNAFANPGLLVLFVLLLLTALPRFGRSAGHLTGARPLRMSWRGRRDSILGWLYLCSMCAVAAIAFLGGDAWLGDLSSSSRTLFVPSLASSLVLVTKYTALVVAVAFLRALSLNVTLEQWGPVSLRICLPLAVLAAGVAQAWRSLDALPPFWHWVKAGFGPISVVAALLGGAVLAWRVSSHLRRSSPPALSPWI